MNRYLELLKLMASVGINGFGRIGRLILRAAVQKGLKILAINDPKMTAEEMVYLLKNDSTHGKYEGQVDYMDGKIILNGQKVTVFSEEEPGSIPWKSVRAKYVIDASGKFRTMNAVRGHLSSGAEWVIVTASSDAPMFIVGVNEDSYTNDMRIVSSSSGTANCLAPMAKVLFEAYGIVEGVMTTVHSSTAAQNVVDGVNEEDWRMGRSATQNIFPSNNLIKKLLMHI